jgi:hypothetical protein
MLVLGFWEYLRMLLGSENGSDSSMLSADDGSLGLTTVFGSPFGRQAGVKT